MGDKCGGFTHNNMLLFSYSFACLTSRRSDMQVGNTVKNINLSEMDLKKNKKRNRNVKNQIELFDRP